MDPTPPLYVFFPPGYQSTQGPPPPQAGGGQMSALIIFFIALAALIALLVMICLIVMIYNVCRYGSCCPPSANGSCCAPSANGSCCAPSSTNCCCCSCYCNQCVAQTTEGSFVKPSSIIVQSPSYGSYVGRGNRLNPGSYVVAPRTIRAGSIPSRRNSVIIVGQNSLPRRQVIQTVRPQIMVSDGGRAPTIGRSSLMALPCPSSSSQSAIRCFPRNEPMTYGNSNDDGEVRVIVRNQPYADSQRGIIMEAPSSSSISPPPSFENINVSKTGGMGYGGGGGGCGGGLDQGGDFGYGFSGGQHSATVDVSFDQVPEYTSDDGIQQFHQTAIYPSLGQTNCY